MHQGIFVQDGTYQKKHKTVADDEKRYFLKYTIEIKYHTFHVEMTLL